MIFEKKDNEIYTKNKRKLFPKIVGAIAIVSILGCYISPVMAKIFPPLPKSTLSDVFPESYLPYIERAKQEHPNWIFKAVYTGLDWNQAVSHESYDENKGISTINMYDYGAEWMYSGDDAYYDGPYKTASKAAVAYTMDPRNYINTQSIFQFETLSFSNSQTVEAVQKILSNTPMGSAAYSNQYKNNGQWIKMDKTYAQLIYDLSKEAGISPIHVASRIKQENSGDIVNNNLLNGSYPGYEGVYNFFNIGASPGGGNDAHKNGIIYASSKGWTTPELAIKAGIAVLKDKYIKWGQDTIYFQKYDVNNPYGTAEWLYGTGYMTNIMAPTNEGIIVYNAYASMLDSAFEFHIPVYENMPASPAPMPTEASTYFEPDNTLIYLDDPSDSGVNDTFPIRSSPDDSIGNANLIINWVETKDGADNRTKFTRIGIGQNTKYDKIRFPDGREGYVWKKWVYTYNYQKVESVTLDKTSLELLVNTSYQLKATVNPSNAYIKDVTWKSSDESIATVDNQGNVTAKKAGSVAITATSNDQLKVATCQLKVTDFVAVQGISFEQLNYTIMKGSTLSIVPTFNPVNATNKNYQIASSDENILKIQNHTIIGQNVGKATATFTTEDGHKTVTVTINVIEESNDTKITIDSSINNNANELSKINPKTTVKSLTSKISYNSNILSLEVKDMKGNLLTQDSLVGTGTVINVFMKDTKDLLDTFKVIIYGDLDGNGNINVLDLLSMKQHLEGLSILKNESLKAANVKKSGNTPNVLDLLSIKQHLEGISLIVQ